MIKRLLLGAVMATAILLGCSVVEVGENDYTYFPLTEGNTWIYEVRTNSGVDTIHCRMIEVGPATFVWEKASQKESGYASIMAMEGDESSEPFNDTIGRVVDSALIWKGVADIPNSKEPSEESLNTVKTPAGVFKRCILITGETQPAGIRFDIWLAPDVGPVQIYRWSGEEITKVLSLIGFVPAS